MLPSVSYEGEVDCGTFLVDQHGILRRVPWRRYRYRWPQSPALFPRPEREIVAWLAGRRVGARGSTLFWFVPTAWSGYRQQHILDSSDAALWRSLPDWFRACHDPFVAPTQYSKPMS
jgi:hypothetical protein